MAIENAVAAGGIALALYLVILLILPILFLIAFWRMGSALHRIAEGMKQYVWARFPETKPGA